MFGWKGDALQKAMDSNCMFQACENGNPLLSQGVEQMNACSVDTMIEEETDGCECFPCPACLWVSRWAQD